MRGGQKHHSTGIIQQARRRAAKKRGGTPEERYQRLMQAREEDRVAMLKESETYRLRNGEPRNPNGA